MFELYKDYPFIYDSLTETHHAIQYRYYNLAAGIICKLGVSMIGNLYLSLSKDKQVSNAEAVNAMENAHVISPETASRYRYFSENYERTQQGVIGLSQKDVFSMYGAVIEEAYLYTKYYSKDTGKAVKAAVGSAVKKEKKKRASKGRKGYVPRR